MRHHQTKNSVGTWQRLTLCSRPGGDGVRRKRERARL
jgi:hypothetical protein